MLELVPATALIVGLLGGTHCLGMCGGIVSALTFGLPEEKRQGLGVLPYHLAYNTGRLLSYSLAGALAGGIGVLIAGLMPLQLAQTALMFVAGVFMVMMGLYVAGWWFGLSKLEKMAGGLWRRIEPVGRRLLPVKSPWQALALGVLWGWLPCGLVYSVLVWSVASGGALDGALLMAAFGLGTLPNIVLMGAAASWLSGYIRKPAVRRIAGGLILAYGLITILSISVRGLGGLL